LQINRNSHEARDNGRGLQHCDTNERRDWRIYADPESVAAAGLTGKIYAAQLLHRPGRAYRGMSTHQLIMSIHMAGRLDPDMNTRLTDIAAIEMAAGDLRTARPLPILNTPQ
jgi:hypothetical protein